MSDKPMTSETANVIVVVRMADDLHHLLTRVASIFGAVAAFFVVAVGVDLWRGDWMSAFLSALPMLGFGLMCRESWNRRAKYAKFANTARGA